MKMLLCKLGLVIVWASFAMSVSEAVSRTRSGQGSDWCGHLILALTETDKSVAERGNIA